MCVQARAVRATIAASQARLPRDGLGAAQPPLYRGRVKALLKPRNLLFVFLMTVGVLGALAWTDVLDAASCETNEGGAQAGAPVTFGPGPVGLSVKAGDPEVTRALREGVDAWLRAHGASDVVDNPVTRPRVDVALESGALRYLPFYATAQSTLRVLVTGPRGTAAAPSQRLTLDETCTGLVGQRAWRERVVARWLSQITSVLGPS